MFWQEKFSNNLFVFQYPEELQPTSSLCSVYIILVKYNEKYPKSIIQQLSANRKKWKTSFNCWQSAQYKCECFLVPLWGRLSFEICKTTTNIFFYFYFRRNSLEKKKEVLAWLLRDVCFQWSNNYQTFFFWMQGGSVFVSWCAYKDSHFLPQQVTPCDKGLKNFTTYSRSHSKIPIMNTIETDLV